jgi:dTDP-4-amino-4,6-dideoxygalactose transaminase
MNKLLHTGRPVIEDCCTAFYSQDAQGKVGRYGDYAIYSFPKFFGLQLGGLLVGENVGATQQLFEGVSLTADEREYVLAVLGGELRREREMLAKRKKIFDYATGRFYKLGFSLRFPNQEGVVPSVLLLSNNDVIADLSAHKEFLSKHGIQNSIFYGEDAFFLPCHQNLTKRDIDYFRFVVSHFIKQQ